MRPGVCSAPGASSAKEGCDCRTPSPLGWPQSAAALLHAATSAPARGWMRQTPDGCREPGRHMQGIISGQGKQQGSASETTASALRRAPSAAELLRAVAAARGWVVGAGLPDEARAGRLLLRDYTAGKLLHCEWPPPPFGPAPSSQAAGASAGLAGGRPAALEGAQGSAQGVQEEARRGAGDGGSSAEESAASSTGAAALLRCRPAALDRWLYKRPLHQCVAVRVQARMVI